MPVKIFFCYAHEDELLLNKLKTHLRPLQRKGLIDVWYDRDISAGTKWEEEIDKHLNEAHIILLLVSPDLMDSDYCYGIEMKRALERDANGEAHVIPIILRPVYWQGTLGELQALPTDAKPVESSYWHSRDEALYNVAEGIRKVVEELISKHKQLSMVAVYEQSTQLDSNSLTNDNHMVNTAFKSPPKSHFKPSQRDIFSYAIEEELSEEHFSIELGKIGFGKKKYVAIRPESYRSLQFLLDDLYIKYLSKSFKAYTYGYTWILASKSPKIKHIVAPWIWFQNKLLTTQDNKHLSTHDVDLEWAFLPPQVYGLEAGTHWQIIDSQIPVFGIATDKPDIAELVLSLSRDDESVKILLHLLEEINPKVVPPEAVGHEDFKFLFIMTSSWFEKYGKVIIL